LIDCESCSRFRRLADVCAGGIFIEDDLHIKIKFQNISLGVFQLERYEKSIKCYIETNISKTRFDFQIVAAALNEYDDGGGCGVDFLDESLIKENSRHLDAFVDFFIAKKNRLCKWPPAWFLSASKYDLARLSENFPTLAEQQRKEHAELWAAWNGFNDGFK
jgi:hypothetical protein